MKAVCTYAALAALIVSAPSAAQDGGSAGETLERSVEDLRDLRSFGDAPKLSPGRLQLPPEVIEDILDRSKVLLPADPFVTPRKLDATILNFQRLCNNGRPSFCVEAAALRASKERLLAGANANLGCVNAADAMLDAYTLGKPTTEVAHDYDLKCLGAFVARAGESAGPAARPAVLSAADQADGLLSAVGVLFLNDKPVCGGLLQEGRRFITARHCRFSTDDSLFTVQQASSEHRWRLRFIRAGQSTGTPSDWVVYEVLAGDDYHVATTKLAALPANGPLTFVAAYPHADPASGGLPGQVPKLRFPRSGLCEAVRQSPGCIQMVCQTVKSFSGAPVFRADSPSNAPEVVGFISGSEGEDANCRALLLERSTLAVSATQIPGGL